MIQPCKNWIFIPNNTLLKPLCKVEDRTAVCDACVTSLREPIAKHAAIGCGNNDCIIQGCCVNFQLAHRKECTFDDLEQCLQYSYSWKTAPNKIIAFSLAIVFS